MSRSHMLIFSVIVLPFHAFAATQVICKEPTPSTFGYYAQAEVTLNSKQVITHLMVRNMHADGKIAGFYTESPGDTRLKGKPYSGSEKDYESYLSYTFQGDEVGDDGTLSFGSLLLPQALPPQGVTFPTKYSQWTEVDHVKSEVYSFTMNCSLQ